MAPSQLDEFPAPAVPVVYLDWNVMQHLQLRTQMDPLLRALMELRTAGAAALPYTIGHMMDASAGWTSPMARHAERTRSMLFADGLTRGLLWEIEHTPDGDRHVWSRESLFDACERRGHFTAISDLVDDDPELVADVEAALAARLEEAEREMRAIAASSPNVPPELTDSMVAALKETFAGGLPDIADAGSMLMRVLAPALLYSRGELISLGEVPVEHAVHRLDKAFRDSCGLGFEAFFASSLEQHPTAHPDDLGPSMLGMLGYYRDTAKSVRRASPGFVADQSHGKHALASTVFLTGDRRLSKRVEAWAAWTRRGPHNLRWPVVNMVSPDDDSSIQLAVETVEYVARRFRGAVIAPE